MAAEKGGGMGNSGAEAMVLGAPCPENPLGKTDLSVLAGTSSKGAHCCN